MLDSTKRLIDSIKNYFVSTNGKTAVIGISGGKDSTIAAALCVKALGKENVFGVLMPNGITKADDDDAISDGKRICEFLGIKYYIFDIHDAYWNILMKVENLLYCQNCKLEEATASNQTKINLAPRIRMTTLYAIAQSMEGGRVINTTNACERFVGYGTLFGDTAGDFAVFKDSKVSDVYKIGDDLGIPYDLVHKTPSDGLTGKSDEEVLGVTYEEIEIYMNNNTETNNYDIPKLIGQEKRDKIWKLHYNSEFKRQMLNIPGPKEVMFD